ncbi:MAG: type II toxin-antitoxin system PemK/MazF family toxin [Terriglobia bacterium]
MRRGEIWWASLRTPAGSEPGYRRPVLVIQTNQFNQSLIRTVVALVMTSNLGLARAPGNVLCKKKDTGLPKDSVINVSQVVTLDKSFLTQRVKTLPFRLLQQVEEGLRLVIGI